MADDTIKLEYRPLSEILKAPRNPKQHAAETLDQSLDRFGYVQPVTVDERTGRLVAGHGRLERLAAWKASGKAAPKRIHVRKDGEWMVPVIRGISFASDAEAEAYLIADNRASEVGRWDDPALASMLDDLLKAGETALLGVGYSAGDVVDLLNPFVAERVDISSLRPHPSNYRAHPADQLEHIIQSIKTHGFYRNVIVARDGTILAGHGVVQAAQKMGRKRIPVVRLDIDPQSPAAMKVLASDNEIAKLAESDDRALSTLLKGLLDAEGSSGLAGTGYDERQLAALVMVTRPASEIRDLNEAAEWVGMPEYEEGGTPIKLVITFPDDEARKQFIAQTGIKIDKSAIKGTTYSTRWPWTEREDVGSVRFEAVGSKSP